MSSHIYVLRRSLSVNSSGGRLESLLFDCYDKVFSLRKRLKTELKSVPYQFGAEPKFLN
ncbi:hypothetical protein [Leptospira adleri]|uniref:hypothetical protein n=1 Tax=Leptospira adleri TaxID=2023186 RepID=UPI0013FDB467|nr:hypothetical protein [Leptospira adleri]